MLPFLTAMLQSQSTEKANYMRYYQEEPREFMTRDDLVAMHTQAPEPKPEPKPEPVDSNLKKLIAAYPNMKFLNKNPDPELVSEWYTILQKERSALGSWGQQETTVLPVNTKYSFQRVYVKHISYYEYSGIKKQRAFFTLASGDNPLCVHSGAITEGLTTGWHQVTFTTSGVDKVHNLNLNKVSALKLTSF
jgi:hypothetical protein